MTARGYSGATRRCLAAVAPVALLALGACDRIPGTNANLDRQAREVLSDTLFDAESAKLRALRTTTARGEDLICGEVNAKNRMGAFGGFHRFIVIPKDREAYVDPQADENSPDEARSYQAGWDAISGACWS